MSTNSLPYILSSLLWIAPFGVWAQTPADRTEAAAALDELYPQVKKRFSDRQYDEAAQLLAKASEWVHLYFDQDSEQYARKHYFEGALALYREDDKAAADHLLIAREGFTRLGSQPGLLMSSINNLAIAYKNLGLYAEAEPYYLESLSLRKSSNGTENPEYARALNNIGNLYLEMEDYKRAEASHLEAFAIRSRILPPDHEDYRQSKFNLANLYSDLGNFSKAEEMFLEILSKATMDAPDNWMAAGLAVRQRREVAMLRIINHSRRPLYYCILDIDAKHRVTTLVPGPSWQPADCRLDPGEQRIHRVIFHEPGREVLKLIATPTPLDFRPAIGNRGNKSGNTEIAARLMQHFKGDAGPNRGQEGAYSGQDAGVSTVILEVIPEPDRNR